MIRVISSPSISTIGFLTLILFTGGSCSFALDVRGLRGPVQPLAAQKGVFLRGRYYSESLRESPAAPERGARKGKGSNQLLLQKKSARRVAPSGGFSLQCARACQPRNAKGVSGRDWSRGRGPVATRSLTPRRGKYEEADLHLGGRCVRRFERCGCGDVPYRRQADGQEGRDEEGRQEGRQEGSEDRKS